MATARRHCHSGEALSWSNSMFEHENILSMDSNRSLMFAFILIFGKAARSFSDDIPNGVRTAAFLCVYFLQTSAVRVLARMSRVAMAGRVWRKEQTPACVCVPLGTVGDTCQSSTKSCQFSICNIGLSNYYQESFRHTINVSVSIIYTPSSHAAQETT